MQKKRGDPRERMSEKTSVAAMDASSLLRTYYICMLSKDSKTFETALSNLISLLANDSFQYSCKQAPEAADHKAPQVQSPPIETEADFIKSKNKTLPLAVPPSRLTDIQPLPIDHNSILKALWATLEHNSRSSSAPETN